MVFVHHLWQPLEESQISKKCFGEENPRLPLHCVEGICNMYQTPTSLFEESFETTSNYLLVN